MNLQEKLPRGCFSLAIAATLQLSDLLQCSASELSGREAQRVALVRALKLYAKAKCSTQPSPEKEEIIQKAVDCDAGRNCFTMNMVAVKCKRHAGSKPLIRPLPHNPGAAAFAVGQVLFRAVAISIHG